jgi:hypothetical protein
LKRLRFSVRTMFVGVSIAALMAWSVTIINRQRLSEARFDEFEAARVQYYAKWIGYEAGTVPPKDVCEASVLLLQRERALCRSNESERNALWAHIERLKMLREKASVPPDFVTSADQQLAAISEHIDQANESLRKLDSLESH